MTITLGANSELIAVDHLIYIIALPPEKQYVMASI